MKIVILLILILCPLHLCAQRTEWDIDHEVVRNELSNTHYLIGQQALWYFSTYDYAVAENYFRYYFSCVDHGNVTDFDLKVLYAYAYNYFLQGNEKSGLKLLSAAAESGYVPACEDYRILSECRTIGHNILSKKSYDYEFEQIRKRYQPFATLNVSRPSEFWEQVASCDRNLTEIRQLLKTEHIPKTLYRALGSIKGAESGMEEYLRECHPHEAGRLEDNLTMSLFESHGKIKELRVYPANVENAFATPYGQIYLTDALVRLYHGHKFLLLGVCAHEATHFCCQHSLVAQWNQEKKVQKNTVLAGIAIGLNAVLQIASGISGSSADFSSLNDSIIDICSMDAFYFQYRYGREQEIEADMVAYRFCEAIGLGGYAYIMALQLLGNGTGYMKASRTSDHPTNNYRVALLKYIYQKEHPEVRR